MTLSLKMARSALLGVTLAASVTLLCAQEEKPPEKTRAKPTSTGQQERHNAPSRDQKSTPAQPQHTPAAQGTPRTERTAPAGDSTTRQQRHDAAPAQTQRTPSVDQPARHQEQQPQTRTRENSVNPGTQHQVQPNSTPAYRAPQSNPAGQSGGQPGGQPGRTFGTNPGNATSPRGSENPRGQTQGFSRPGGPPSRNYTTPSGDVIHRDAGGQVRQVRMNNGTVVYHPPNGPRRVEMARPGGGLVVASAPGHGYVQRNVTINNTTIIKRTYIYNGVPQARIYRPRVYNGITLAIYTPVRYYRPTFYAYAYNPWARPISYSWGWGVRPWYGYYGGYFTPYPVYASPSLWLTDYLIAATLEAAYEERMAARAEAASAYQNSQSAPMTPEVKQAIADEVRRQIDMERSQGQAGNSAGMDSNIFADNVPHVFVVQSGLMVNSGTGECSIAEGDVLQMNNAPPPNSPYADVVVLSSRGADCRKGSRVSVALQDLQEMHNQMRATLDRGMGDLQTKQGQGGLPPAPQGSTGTIDSAYAQSSQPDANVASELSSVSQEADRAEQQAVSQGETLSGPPPVLTLGLSIDQVKAVQGEPQKIVDLGSKQIYVYKDLKITFSDGKVTDIQ